MSRQRAILILLGCSFIWGASFTLNKMVLTMVAPMTYVAVRFGLGALFLAPLYRRTRPADWRVGLPLGLLFGIQLALFFAGLATVPPARAAFLLGVQTAFVPILVLAWHRRWPTGRELCAVALAMVGSWFFTRQGGGVAGLSRGDGFILASAVAAAIYLVAAGQVGRHDPLDLLAVQLIPIALVGLALMLALETPRFELNLATGLLVPFLTLGSIASFSGQLLGQRVIRPTEASLIFALEPVFAAIVSYLSLGDRLTANEGLGGGLILTAAVLVATRPSPAIADRADPVIS